MRILHVDSGLDMRGGQHQVLLLLKVLGQAGHSCKLLARGPLLQLALNAGLDAAAASPRMMRRSSADCDLVHVHDSKSHTWAALVSRRPFVVSRRVAFPVSTSLPSRLKYRQAARYLAVSRFVAQKLAEAGIPQSKIDVVYDAIEAPKSVPPWSADGPVIALASFDPKKGRDLVAKAAKQAAIPIIFSTDLLKDLAQASAFIYVSRSEGFGSAALLAMAAGVPLIASQIEGLAEVFEDGLSGLAVANEAESIAAALLRLRANPALARSLIQQGRTRALSFFNTTTLLESTVLSYQRALGL